jgi:protein-disulfide isomerase
MNQPPADPFAPSGPPGSPLSGAENPPGGGPPEPGGGPFGPPGGYGGGPPPGGGFGGPPGGYGGGPPPGGGFGGPPSGYGGGPPPGGGFGGPPGGYGGGPPPGGGFGGPPGGYGAPPGGPFGPPGFAPLVAPRPPSSSSSSVGLIIGIVAAVLVLLGMVVAGAAFFVRARAHSAATPTSIRPADDEAAYGGDEVWSDEDASVPVSSRDPMWGKRAAPVTIVLFSDFQCPFCSRFETTLAAVKAKYGPEKVRIVWKSYPLPFHKDARPTAIAAEAVFRAGGSRAFWKFHDAAFANQPGLTQESFERWAQEAGVDVQTFRTLQADPLVALKIDTDMGLAKGVGAQGTPNTFINGFLLTGAQPLEKVTSLVDTELSSAERAIAAGTPPERVYSKLSLENKTRNPPPKKDADPTPEDENKIWSVPAGNSPSRGPASAKVTIVQFADFQCPFCNRAEPTLGQLREIYGDKIRIVWKNNPLAFHTNAGPAAELALEARAQKGDAGFWAAHDLLFKNQKNLSADDLAGYAAQLKLDVGRAQKAIAGEKHKAAIDEDQRLAGVVTALGTPAFFINGHKLVGAQPLEKFKALIDKELAK